jgi:hypothetical protein
MEKLKMDKKVEYEIVEYTRKVLEWSKEVRLHDDSVNFHVDSVAGGHEVAALAKFKTYGIFRITTDKNGHFIGDKERVFVSAEVPLWEKQVQDQLNARDTRRTIAIDAINALPAKIVLFAGGGMRIVAERSNAHSDYKGFDVKYYGTVFFKGEELGRLCNFITDGYRSKGSLLKKKFAQEVFEKLHRAMYMKQGYSQWKETLRNIPEAFVVKYGEVLNKAVAKLNTYNDKISIIKSKL